MAVSSSLTPALVQAGILCIFLALQVTEPTHFFDDCGFSAVELSVSEGWP